MKLLASNKGAVFSSGKLIQQRQLWRTSNPRPSDVTKLVQRLRKKIEDLKNPKIVVTVRGFGYKLSNTVDVSFISPPPAPLFADKIQQALDKIKQDCEKRSQGLQTHHLLIALLKVQSSTWETLKQAKPLDPSKVLQYLESAVNFYPIKAGMQTCRYQRVIENARKIAQNAGSTIIEESHLFLAILLEADSGSPTVELLKRLGYDINQLWSMTDPSSTDPNALKKILGV